MRFLPRDWYLPGFTRSGGTRQIVYTRLEPRASGEVCFSATAIFYIFY